MQPKDMYWATIRKDLAWPFTSPDAVRSRPSPDLWRRRLEQLGDSGEVPFHAYCLANRVPACVRDALGMLAIVALVPEHRRAANQRSPWSPAVPAQPLDIWASRSMAERHAVASWLEPASRLVTDGLVDRHGDEVIATSALLELAAGRGWLDNSIPGVVALAADSAAHVGVADDHDILKLGVLVSSLRDLVPVIHLVGGRGSGRLRVASAAVARAGVSSLLVVPATHLVETPHLLDAVVAEARGRAAALVITEADAVERAFAARVTVFARARRMMIWTTSEQPSRWSASAMTWTLPTPTPLRRRAAWIRELERRALHVDGDALDKLSELPVPRHAIGIAVETATRIYRTEAFAALSEIASHFCEGASHGM